MKTLIIGIFLLQNIAGFAAEQPRSPAETVAKELCEIRKNAYDDEFDVVQCVLNGVHAYPQGKLAHAKATCFSFELEHRVGLRSRLNCFKRLSEISMPNEDEFQNAYKKCSPLEDKAMTMLSGKTYDSDTPGFAKNFVYECMNTLF